MISSVWNVGRWSNAVHFKADRKSWLQFSRHFWSFTCAYASWMKLSPAFVDNPVYTDHFDEESSAFHP
jgi:hypothetical protein